MQLTEEQVALLLVKRIAGSLTPEEEHLLDSWANASPANRQQYEELTNLRSLRHKMREYGELTNDHPLREKMHEYGELEAPDPRKRGMVRWLAAAVAAAAVLALVYYTPALFKKEVPLVVAKERTIMPASAKAILTLGDGSNITLDSSNRAIGQGILQRGQQLVYNNTPSFSYNLLRTPRGGQYSVTLPDGTRVWLNAASSLRYPTVFKGRERKVEISGEAWFEVAQHAAQPFIVEVPGKLKVEVLGTEFNVNAYADEPVINTTLVNGKVRVGDKTLQPGQQASLANGEIRLVAADMDQVTAWRKGIFNFRDAGLPAVMRQLSRWYDVDVVYEGKVPESVFTGKIGRDLTLEDVVEGLKRSEVNCRIAGRKLIVMP